ncbi:MAG: LON peptidase substrate-binding domain-containing protein, partial [Mycobacteriales bacterium]
MTTLRLPVLPLDDEVVLPGMVVPVRLDGPEAAEVRAAVEAAQAAARAGGDDAEVLLVPRLDGKYAAAGALGVIEQIGRLPGGEKAAVVRGVARAVIGAGTTGPGAALWVEAEVTDDDDEVTDRARELAKEYKGLVVSILQQRGAWQVVDTVQQVTDPSALADMAGYASYLTLEQKVRLLEITDVVERLETLITAARDHLAELDVADTIRKDVQEGMERQQREFLLRQQLAAIRKELAELDGKPASEEQDYRARVEAADLPDKVREAALAEVDKLERTSDQSPEVGWIRTWLDTVLDIPWNTRTEDVYDLPGAREILDADHAGLDDVKERIVEYLAVRKRRADRGLGVVGGRRSGAVLALVGPPGVGKTS